jgi:hypothetical protein
MLVESVLSCIRLREGWLRCNTIRLRSMCGLFRFGPDVGWMGIELHPILFDPNAAANLAQTCRVRCYTIRLRIVCGLFRFDFDPSLSLLFAASL